MKIITLSNNGETTLCINAERIDCIMKDNETGGSIIYVGGSMTPIRVLETVDNLLNEWQSIPDISCTISTPNNTWRGPDILLCNKEQ